MNSYVVWMDMDLAKLFKVEVDGPKAKIVRRHEIKHHTSRDPKNHKYGEKYFHEVARKLRDADEVFLTGPGLAKIHFKDHLARHHHQKLAEKIVGVKPVDQMPDAQVLALSREFFRVYDLFGQALIA